VVFTSLKLSCKRNEPDCGSALTLACIKSLCESNSTFRPLDDAAAVMLSLLSHDLSSAMVECGFGFKKSKYLFLRN